MPRSLIIVESPAKTRTIRQFVGKGYELAASMGHVRDLPKSTLGVDVESDFKPKYVTIRERSPTVKKLREAAAKAEDVYAIQRELSEKIDDLQMKAWKAADGVEKCRENLKNLKEFSLER